MVDVTWNFNVIDYAVLIGIVAILLVAGVAKYFSIKNESLDGIDRKFYKERWKSIQDLMSYGKEMNYKLAVIEADKLLDQALKDLHFSGETMAERLKLASYKFPNLKKVWWAHKVRNLIVHDVRYQLKFNEAKKVVSLFHNSLTLLKII